VSDIVSAKKRSEMMAGIKSKNTKPELIIRRSLHRRGLRYRLQAKHLPGRPDIFLRKYNAAIFIHGCFWHAHGCHLFKMPSTRTEFWTSKFEENKSRDKRNVRDLLNSHHRVCIVWECAIKHSRGQKIESLIGDLIAWIRSDISYTEFS
jgi:DNA mismatch endonuclease (patch repair protein)